MKRILITGGNGFLGSSLVRYFLDKECEVAVISRSDANIKDIIDKITYIELDSTTYYSIQDKIKLFSPEYVIHSAWSGGNSNIYSNAISQFDNISLSVSLLDILRSLEKTPRFIGIGSFEEYGTLNKKAKETDVECPTNFYGLSKLAFKNVSKVFCEEHLIPWAWIRPCYIYGPGDVSTRLIPRTINSLLTETHVTLNSCNATLDYLHITDFCSAMGTLVNLNLAGIYNICSGQEYNLKDILSFIQTQTSSSAYLRFDSTLDTNDVQKYICGANEKIKSFGWDITMDLHAGLMDTVSYYKSIM